MGPRARRGVLYVGVPAAVALVATACFPARQPPPPPPPTSTCSAASVPSQQHPVTYTAVVKDSSGRPNAHAFTATSAGDKDAKTAQLEQQGQVTSVQPTQVLKSLDTLTPGDLTDDVLFNRRTTSNDGHTVQLSTSITAADGNFAQTDVGAVITDSLGDLAPGTRIAGVSTPTAATISQPAIGLGHINDVFTITGQRSTTSDGQTNATTSITAADGAFTSRDVGAVITDSLGDIPSGTTISAVSSSVMATISAAATGTHVNDVFTITAPPLHEQWSLAASPGANFQSAWSTQAGHGTRIALVDTGVKLNHQSFASPAVVPGPNFVNDGMGALVTGDPNGHGTHTAGIAGAQDIDSSGNATIDGAPGAGDTLGGAPNATILAARALDASGSGFDSDVANGITWAATPTSQTVSFNGGPPINGGGAQVISLSLGGPCPDNVLLTALQYAKSQNVVVVAAAGNDGNCSAAEWPGAYSTDASTSVIAVASTDQNGNRSSFSNCASYVNIAAPGGSILSTWNASMSAYETLSGTSMATPYVGAAAALVKEECGLTATPDLVKHELLFGAGSPVPGFLFRHLDAGGAVARNCNPN